METTKDTNKKLETEKVLTAFSMIVNQLSDNDFDKVASQIEIVDSAIRKVNQ